MKRGCYHQMILEILKIFNWTGYYFALLFVCPFVCVRCVQSTRIFRTDWIFECFLCATLMKFMFPDKSHIKLT